LLDNLTDSATWEDLIYRIYVRHAIEAGIRNSSQGKTVDVEEFRRTFGLAAFWIHLFLLAVNESPSTRGPRVSQTEKLLMEIPHAPLKDLRSTGYFFDELKAYSASADMDLTTYCVSFVSPYLAKVCESHDKLGHFAKSGILKLAVRYLSNPRDEEIVDSIFGLWKVAVSEVDRAAKTDFAVPLDKSETVANRQKLQAAEFLVKLLVNIIKMFKLAESSANSRKADETTNPVFKTILESWEVLEGKIS